MGQENHPAGRARLTPEEQMHQEYQKLLGRYGENPEVMDALARAWRLGFNRCIQLHGGSERAMTINPFWR